MAEPMMISSPIHKQRRNQVTYATTSLLDIVPTLLDWYNITYLNEAENINDISLPHFTGRSLMPLLITGKINILYIICYIYIYIYMYALCLYM